jgi:hypothetical protein
MLVVLYQSQNKDLIDWLEEIQKGIVAMTI